VELAVPHLADHRALVTHDAAVVDLDLDLAVGLFLDLARGLLERLGPARALGRERGDAQLLARAAGDRRRTDGQRGRGRCGGVDETTTGGSGDLRHRWDFRGALFEAYNEVARAMKARARSLRWSGRLGRIGRQDEILGAG